MAQLPDLFCCDNKKHLLLSQQNKQTTGGKTAISIKHTIAAWPQVPQKKWHEETFWGKLFSKNSIQKHNKQTICNSFLVCFFYHSRVNIFGIWTTHKTWRVTTLSLWVAVTDSWKVINHFSHGSDAKQTPSKWFDTTCFTEKVTD